MKTTKWQIPMVAAVVALTLTACGSTSTTSTSEPAKDTTATAAQGQEKKVTYNGAEVTIPASTERVVVTDHNVVEFLEALKVKAVGVPTYAGEKAPHVTTVTADAVSIGEKGQANLESVLKQKPDVILLGDHTDTAIVPQFEKIAPTFQIDAKKVSWRDNLTFLGEVTGKQAEAKSFIEQFDAKLAKTKEALQASDVMKQKVMSIRIRGGESIYVYAPTSYLNITLYQELGLPVPTELQGVKGQEKLALEKLSEINPDHLFIQVSPLENAKNPNILEDLEKNPIWGKLEAVKNNHVYVNVIEPLANANTGWAEDKFLDAAAEKLLKK